MVIDCATVERHLKKEVLRIGIELFRVMQARNSSDSNIS